MYELIQEGNKFRFSQDRITIQQYSSGIHVRVKYDDTYKDYIFVWRYSQYIGMEDAFPLEYDNEKSIMTLPYGMFKDVTKDAKVFLQGKATNGDTTIQTNTISIKVIKSLSDIQIVSPDDPNDITLITDIVDQKLKTDIIPAVEQITIDARQYRDEAKLNADQAETVLSDVGTLGDQKKESIKRTAVDETSKACTAIKAYKDDKNAELQQSVDGWKTELSEQTEKAIADATNVLDGITDIAVKVEQDASIANDSKDAALQAKDQANTYATNAETSAQDAKDAETNAVKKASESSSSATLSAQSATNASASATQAKASETEAKKHWTNAQAEAHNARVSELNAKTSETKAKENADLLNSSTDKITSNEVTANKALLDAGNAQLTADAGIIGNNKNTELISILDGDIDTLKREKISEMKLASVEGRTITVADGANFFLDEYRSYGESYQAATTGTQLFDPSKIPSKTQGGATVTNNNDGSFTVSGSGTLTEFFQNKYNLSHSEIVKLFKSGNLSLLCESITNPYVSICFYDGGTFLFELCNKSAPTFTRNIEQEILDKETVTASIMFYGINNSKIVTSTIKPMIYQTGNGTWEQYTGGKASPNLEYPQEIISKEVSEITVTGAQLFDASKLASKSQGGATVTNDGDGSFTISGSVASTGIAQYYELTQVEKEALLKSGKISIACEYLTKPHVYLSFHTIENGTRKVIAEINNTSEATKTTIITQDYIANSEIYVRIGFSAPTNAVITPCTIKPMIYQDGDGVWEPYKEQKITLSQPIVLNGLPIVSGGNIIIGGQRYISDSIEMVNNDINVIQRVKCEVFDGSADENWIHQSTNSQGIVNFYVTRNQIPGSQVKCDKLTEQKTLINYTLDEGFFYDEYNIFIRLKSEKASNIEQLRTYLSTNNIKFLYAMANEVKTPLPLEDQIKIKSLCTYKGVSNISDNANTHKQVSYVVDFDKYAYIKQKPFDLALIAKKEGHIVQADDSANYYLKNIGVFGESSQTTATGINLIDRNKYGDLVHNGVTFTKNNDGSVMAKGTANTGNAQLYLGEYIDVLKDGVKYTSSTIVKIVENGTQKYIFSFTVDKASMTSIMPYLQVTKSNTINEVLYPILNEGTATLPWEPCTGGKPSPSYDYPQEIISKTVKDIVITGAQLANMPNVEGTQVAGIMWSCKNGVITAKGTATAISTSQSVGISFSLLRLENGTYYVSGSSEKIKVYVSKISKNTQEYHSEKSITKDGTETRLMLYVQVEAGATVDGYVMPMINKGTTLLPFEPYKEQKITLSQPIVLNGLPVTSGGNVAIDGQQYLSDSIEMVNGVIGFMKRINVLDNSTWTMTNTSTEEGHRFMCLVRDAKKVRYTPVISTHYQCKMLSSYNIKGDYISTDELGNSRIMIRTFEKDFENISDFVAWMKNQNVKTLYIVEKPVFTPLSDQQAIKDLQTYSHNTIITAGGAWIQAEYVADQRITQDRLNKRLEALEGVVIDNV